MCLAVPAKIVSLDGFQAVVDLHGTRVRVTTLLTPEVRAEDWVLVHAGFSIQRLDEQAALQTWAVLDDAASHLEPTDQSRQVATTTSASDPADDTLKRNER